MSLETRYDSWVKDLLTLLQQALCRFFTNKDVDVSKFQQYFNQFYSKISLLEEQFHDRQTRFSQSLSKLNKMFSKPSQPQKVTQHQLQTRRKPVQSSPCNKLHSASQNNTLNPIDEKEETEWIQQFQYRSSTLENNRKGKNYSLQLERNERPKTSLANSKNKNNDINLRYNPSLRTWDQDTPINLGQKQFYQQLQQAKISIPPSEESMIKLPKKRSVSSQRWSYKVSRYF